MAPVHYRTPVFDSARWEGFELRDGDVVVTTPPKCGTTWTQLAAVLLLHGTTVLPGRLADVSPFLDHTGHARRDVVEALEAQRHRRVIKTHTPLDGLPHHPDATYVCVGRDPRDVALSMDAHLANLDRAVVLERRVQAALRDGVALPDPAAPVVRPATVRERFWEWVDDDRPVTAVASTLRRTLHHVATCVRPPAGLDVVVLHYDDLRGDLAGTVGALADRLGVTVPADRWPALLDALSFGSMRRRAGQLAPDAGLGTWRDERAFFRSGTSGGWADLLDGADRARYRRRAESLGPEDVVRWIHRPPL